MKLLQKVCNGMVGMGILLLLGIAGASDCGTLELNQLVGRAAVAVCLAAAGMALPWSAKRMHRVNGGMAHGKRGQSKIKTAVSA